MSTDSASLKGMIEEADAIAARVRDAQHATTLEIRKRDPELAALLDQLWPDTARQASWLFKRLSGGPGRPVDLIVSGEALKVHEIAQAILHGVFR